MSRILIINGSPSATSRTGQLLSYFARQLADDGWQVSELALRTLPAEALLSANFNAQPLAAAQREVAEADAIVVATPVYKAAYTALLKAFLDVLPQQALADKSVLPVASGGTLSHYGVIDYALKPVLSALGATYTLPGFFVLDADLKSVQGGAGFNPEILSRLENSRIALNHLHRVNAAAVPLHHYGS